MSLATTIAESEALIQWLDEAIDGTEVKSTIRVRIATGCLDISLEHQKAIVLLAARQLYGSAFALVRLIFEAYARGVWLHRCATDVEIERFKTGRLDRTFEALLQDVERIPGFEIGVLSTSKRKSWDAMNDFTHAGYVHVTRRNTDLSIEPNYAEDEIVEAIGFANAIALLASVEVALLAGDEKLAQSVLERSRDFGARGA